MMAEDPSLAEYVGFQKQIVKGIADYRKLQLKARLDAIQVGTGWLGVSQGVWRVAASFVVATAIGLGSYVYWPDQNQFEKVSSPLEIDDEEIVADFAAEEVPEVPVPIEEVSEKAESSETLIAKTKSVAEVKEEVAPVEAKESEKVAPKPKEEFVPDVNKPLLSNVVDESLNTKGADMPESVPTEWVSTSDQPMDIETIDRRSKEIKYKYFEGKLFLYGDFKNEPYEILEINSSESKEVYLFYMSKYYKIELTDDIKVLEPIVDEKFIQELRIIRHNKVD